MREERARDVLAFVLNGLGQEPITPDLEALPVWVPATLPESRGVSGDVLAELSDGEEDLLGWLGLAAGGADTSGFAPGSDPSLFQDAAPEFSARIGRETDSDLYSTDSPARLPGWKTDGSGSKPGGGSDSGTGGGGNGKGKNKDGGGTTGDGTTGDGSGSGGTTGDGSGTGGTSGGDQPGAEPAPQYAIDALTSGYSYAAGVTISYAFLQSLPSYYASSDPEAYNFSAFSDAQMTAARSILDGLSSLIDVTFVESSSGGAMMTFANASLGSGIGGWAYYPYSTSTSAKASDIWMNGDYGFNQAPTAGDYGYLALIHEIGHAMGLEHSFEGSYTLSGIEDTRQYTVESYSKHPTMGGWEPQTYMPYDIAALQEWYGANMSTNADDTVYGFSSLNNEIRTVWDAGGNDTFDASGETYDVSIDLHSGAFSSIGSLNGSSVASNNVAIAYNVQIENAVGGSGDDVLIGNAADNVLTGGAGADRFVFDGDGSNDTVADFEDGLDLFDLVSLGITMADVSVTDGTDGAFVDFGAGSISLVGVAADQIDETDFLFA